MTTDDFIQESQAAGLSEDEAWNAYSQKRGGVNRAEFASCWLFWGSAIGSAIATNPSIIED